MIAKMYDADLKALEDCLEVAQPNGGDTEAMKTWMKALGILEVCRLLCPINQDKTCIELREIPVL
jgi:hypothetical protein